MNKEVVRVTVVMEYEPTFSNYPDCQSVAEAAAFDEQTSPFLMYPDVYLIEDEIKSVTFEAVTVE
ncbi:hypothetical protein ABT115_08580 [Streptomyces sp. NPDC001832]|uniref:hypothetical protein n=1 Tax=Streptomyces sp. NPDC001832 TaxID=3154527 RepID=UPI003320D6DB